MVRPRECGGFEGSAGLPLFFDCSILQPLKNSSFSRYQVLKIVCLKAVDIRFLQFFHVLIVIQGEDSISPLRKALVESTPPLCGKISEGLHEYKTQLLDEN